MAKILVIDDESEFLDVMRLVLEQRGGHQAVLSADSVDGLAQALADPPDLAIIDVMMPGMNGYEVCRQLRADPATASVPIIILTARGQLVDRQAALDAGADEYLTKPIPATELLEWVNDLLARKVPEEPPALKGTVVLMSLRGGVGVTTLAVNLAATLAQAGDDSPPVGRAGGGRAVCLIDLCSSSGHVALQLGLRPEPNWSDLARPSVPNTEIIEAHLLQHASGLRVLASPVLPIVRQGLPRIVVQRMLTILHQRFSAIVVDAPSVLDETTMAVLEAATTVGLVINAEPPSIQAAIGTLRVLNQWSAKLQIILNHVTPESRLPTGAIERALKRPLAWTIPFDPAQARALTQGTPLALHSPNSPLALAVRELAQTLSR